MQTSRHQSFRRDRRVLLEEVTAKADVRSVELAGRTRDDLALLLRAKTAHLQNGSHVRAALADIAAIALVALDRHDELQGQHIAIRLGDANAAQPV